MAQYHAVTVLENLGLLQLDRGRLDQLPASSIWLRIPGGLWRERALNYDRHARRGSHKGGDPMRAPVRRQ